MTDDDARRIAAFLIESGHLKRTPRSGWAIAGAKTPESVAEHSYRTAVIAYVIAVLEGANPDRAATLAVFHDVPEARTGDIPSVGKRYIQIAPPVEVARDQLADVPPFVADKVLDLIGEFETRSTPEALCAKDADKIECLLQAREYQTQGYQLVQPWVDTMVAAVRTESGKRLATAALEVPVDRWWHDIVASYGTAPDPVGTTSHAGPPADDQARPAADAEPAANETTQAPRRPLHLHPHPEASVRGPDLPY